LDASGGSAFRNLLSAAKGALIRAAASTQTFGGLIVYEQVAQTSSRFGVNNCGCSALLVVFIL
jgi:hypothetical protein